MRKRSGVKQLGRSRDARRMLIRSLIVKLFEHGDIETSEARAKILRREADRVINKIRRGDLASLRNVASYLGGNKKTLSLVSKAAARVIDGSSGLTRIRRLGRRRGDSSQRFKIELILKKEPNGASDKKSTGK